MDLKIVCYILGRLVIAETIIMFIPFLMALYNSEASIQGFAVALGLCASVGMILLSNGRVRVEHLTMREGIAITGLGWILATSLGMLPFVCGGYLGVLDAWFESISGFTGTGATVMESLSVIPSGELIVSNLSETFSIDLLSSS